MAGFLACDMVEGLFFPPGLRKERAKKKTGALLLVTALAVKQRAHVIFRGWFLRR